MTKYKSVRELLTEELHGRNDVTFEVSPLATIEEITTTHCPSYVERFFKGDMTAQELRRVGFPWTISGVQRSASSVGGTIAAMRAVCEGNSDCDEPPVPVAAHLAGGTHHAFYDRGEGFCVFSDIAIAANIALKDYPGQVDRVCIIDLDVHQGNGNAVLFENDPRVFTFSMHCQGNYFSEVRHSDLDVEVEIGATDDTYLQLLAHHLPLVLEECQPQLIFYQAGVDALGSDRLGKLSLSQDGLQRRDQLVYDACKRANIPLVVTMGGGYPTDLDQESVSYREVIRAHVNVYKGMLSLVGEE